MLKIPLPNHGIIVSLTPEEATQLALMIRIVKLRPEKIALLPFVKLYLQSLKQAVELRNSQFAVTAEDSILAGIRWKTRPHLAEKLFEQTVTFAYSETSADFERSSETFRPKKNSSDKSELRRSPEISLKSLEVALEEPKNDFLAQAEPRSTEGITEFLSLEPRIEEILSMSLPSPPPYSEKFLGHDVEDEIMEQEIVADSAVEELIPDKTENVDQIRGSPIPASHESSLGTAADLMDPNQPSTSKAGFLRLENAQVSTEESNGASDYSNKTCSVSYSLKKKVQHFYHPEESDHGSDLDEEDENEVDDGLSFEVSSNFSDILQLVESFENLEAWLCSARNGRNAKKFKEIRDSLGALISNAEDMFRSCQASREITEGEVFVPGLLSGLFRNVLTFWINRGFSPDSRPWQQTSAILTQIVDIISDYDLVSTLRTDVAGVISVFTHWALRGKVFKSDRDSEHACFDQLNALLQNISTRMRHTAYLTRKR